MCKLIRRDECCGVFPIAEERWRGYGETVSTPRGGRTDFSVDTSSN